MYPYDPVFFKSEDFAKMKEILNIKKRILNRKKEEKYPDSLLKDNVWILPLGCRGEKMLKNFEDAGICIVQDIWQVVKGRMNVKGIKGNKIKLLESVLKEHKIKDITGEFADERKIDQTEKIISDMGKEITLFQKELQELIGKKKQVKIRQQMIITRGDLKAVKFSEIKVKVGLKGSDVKKIKDYLTKVSEERGNEVCN